MYMYIYIYMNIERDGDVHDVEDASLQAKTLVIPPPFNWDPDTWCKLDLCAANRRCLVQ